METLYIATPPEGNRKHVGNPFIAYHFGSGESVAPFPKEFTELRKTVRNMFSKNPVDEINA